MNVTFMCWNELKLNIITDYLFANDLQLYVLVYLSKVKLTLSD